MEHIGKIIEQIEQQQQTTGKTFSNDIVYPHESVVKSLLSNLMFLCNKRGVSFIADEENTAVIELLARYFNNDPLFETFSPTDDKLSGTYQPYSSGWSLRKGIWLVGNYGSGKSMLMEGCRMMSKSLPRSNFGIKSCDEMNGLFISRRYEGLNHYTKKVYHESKKHILDFCFDDLGEEETTCVSWGNKICVMTHVLGERYRNYNVFGNKTHITTNKSLEEVKSIYGGRIHSRTHEMFNIIILGGSEKSTDRRINK